MCVHAIIDHETSPSVHAIQTLVNVQNSVLKNKDKGGIAAVAAAAAAMKKEQEAQVLHGNMDVSHRILNLQSFLPSSLLPFCFVAPLTKHILRRLIGGETERRG